MELPYLTPPLELLLTAALRLEEELLLTTALRFVDEPLLTAALRFVEVLLPTEPFALLTLPTVGVLLYELPTSRREAAPLGVTPVARPMFTPPLSLRPPLRV